MSFIAAAQQAVTPSSCPGPSAPFPPTTVNQQRAELRALLTVSSLAARSGTGTCLHRPKWSVLMQGKAKFYHPIMGNLRRQTQQPGIAGSKYGALGAHRGRPATGTPKPCWVPALPQAQLLGSSFRSLHLLQSPYNKSLHRLMAAWNGACSLPTKDLTSHTIRAESLSLKLYPGG